MQRSPVIAISVMSLLFMAIVSAGQNGAKPVNVKFHEPKTDVSTEASAPIDPTLRINLQMVGNMAFGLSAEGVRLCFGAGSIQTLFKINNVATYPNTLQPAKLPDKTPNGKSRHGYYSAFKQGNLTITQVVEAVPSRPAKPGDQRKMHAALVRYIIENKDQKPHTVAARVRIDTHCNNDGALFAAPTMPKQILNGIELKDKTLPPFVKIMQVPNLEAPGATGHFTLKFGSRMIGPDRFVCTAHGVGDNGWDVTVQQSNGDSDCVMYWKPATVAPGATVTLAYAYGIGIATTPDSEGRVSIAWGGSFEPNKLFTITAYVEDPISNQTIELELPRGMELVEGKRVEPVPAPPPDSATSLVLWKCRVKDLGEHNIRFRSSNGVTQTRTITIGR
jgi:hypothetical protein